MIRIVALIAMVLAGSAYATPPRITASDDRLVGATQTHLYVLRDISDNVGSHYQDMRDQHLIEIDLETGEATQYWPLRRIAVSNLETDEYLYPGHVTERAGDTHDMMAVLRDVGAAPLAPHNRGDHEITLENGVLMRKGTKLATPFGIRAAGRAQLAILRDEYPPFETEEDYRDTSRINFYDLYAEGDWECQILPEGQSLSRAKDRVTVVKLHCEDFEYSGLWSFHMIMRDEIQN